MALVAVLMGFTSCNEEKDPVFQKPTEFVLNTPPMASQYYELTPEGSMVFTCSQPNYGFTASTTYGLEIALTEGGETYSIPAEVPTSATIRVKTQAVAEGICALRGIKSEDDWVDQPARPLWVRATAQLGTHGQSFIESNWVKLDQVKEYFAIPQPGYIYLVGSPEGWKGPDEANKEHYKDWRLFEKTDAIGSQVYYGLFDMPAAPMFRFYTALTGWDADSWGSQVDDNPKDVSLEADGSLTETLVKGKGAFNFPGFTGGQMTIIVDMTKEKVTFVAGNAM